MPKPPKTLENMTKHLTGEEAAARAEAEAALLPDRPHLRLKPPPYVREDKAAARYWRGILKRMEGLSLLDSLDAEILGVYCAMLARRDRAQAVFASLLEAAAEGANQEAQARLEGLFNKLQGQERVILSYADKLGLTPAGRLHLARKRAAQAAGEGGDDDSGLFGD